MPFNCNFYCDYFDIYHSGLAWPALFFVTIYIVKISTVRDGFLKSFKQVASCSIIDKPHGRFVPIKRPEPLHKIWGSNFTKNEFLCLFILHGNTVHYQTYFNLHECTKVCALHLYPVIMKCIIVYFQNTFFLWK